LTLRGEVVGEHLEEVLRGGDALFLRLGEDGVLLHIGRHDVFVVALGVGGGEVAPQLGGDVGIADLVAVGVAVDANDAILCPAELVLAEAYCAHSGLLSGKN